MPNVYNVIDDYGAVADGATDDTAAVGSALTAAGAAGGGIVYFPEGNYSLGAVSVSVSNVTLLFAPGVVITCRTGTTTANFEVTGDDVHFVSSKATFVGGGFTTFAIFFNDCARGRIQGLFLISGYTSYAVACYLADDFLIDGLRVTDQSCIITNGGLGITLRNVKLTITTGAISEEVFMVTANVSGEVFEDVTIEDVTITATGGTQTKTAMVVAPNPDLGPGSTLQRAENVIVRNVRITGWDHDAFNVLNCDGVLLDGVTQEDSDGIFVESINFRLEGCLSIRSEGSGFTFGDPSVESATYNGTIVNCQAIDCGRGLGATGERDRAGFVCVGNTTGDGTVVQNLTFVGCQALDTGTDNQLYGLSLYEYCDGIKVYACDFNDNVTAPIYAGTVSIKNISANATPVSWLNAKDFGCIGDSLFTQDGAITSGLRVLTCTSADPFLSSDAAVVVTSVGSGGSDSTGNSATITGAAGGAAVLYDVVANVLANVRVTNRGSGMTTPTISFPQVANATATLNLIAGSLGGLFLEVPGAAAAGDVLATRISAYFAADTVHLDTTAGTTVSGATVCVHRTDELDAMQDLVDAASRVSQLPGQAIALYFPAGVYSGVLPLGARTDYLICGDGPATTLAWLGSLSGYPIITLTSCQRVVVRDMRLFGGNIGLSVNANARGSFLNLFIEGQKRGTLRSVSGITRVGTTATATTTTNHGLTASTDYVTVMGSTIFQYNGTFLVASTPTTTTFTYTIPNDPGASAAGTLTCCKAGDGDGLYINGDGSTEIYCDGLYIHDFEGFGLHYTRTTTTDSGGLFLNNVKCGMKLGTSGISGFRFSSTQNTGTNAFLRMAQCVADNFASGPSMEFIRVKDLDFSQCWTSSNIATRGSVVLADCKEVSVNNCKFDNQSTTGYTVQIDSGQAGGCANINVAHSRITGNTSGSTAFRLTTSAAAGTFTAINCDDNEILGSPTYSNVLTGYGDSPTLALPVGFNAANLTTVTILVAGSSYYCYVGKAPAGVTSCNVLCNITTAYTGGAGQWGEVGIFKGATVGNGNASLTRVGTTSFTNTTGRKVTAVTLAGLHKGDDVWVCVGSNASTPAQFRAGLADDLQSGMFQSAAVRPSLASTPQATTLAAATLAVPWLIVEW